MIKYWYIILLITNLINGNKLYSQNSISESNINSLVEPYVLNESFSGAILIAKNDSIIFENYYGLADKEFDVKVSSSTIFKLASVSKQFTATGILILCEQGLLSLETTLDQFIPEIKNSDKITIHHLLTHSSGISSYTDLNKYDKEIKYKYLSVTEIIDIIKSLPSDFQPGTNTKYSNSGYAILAYIIEKISGLSFKDFMNQYIFHKAQLETTGVDNNELILKRRARGYQFLEGSLINAPYIDVSVTIGAGGLYSTTHDLLKWYKSLTNHKVINESSLRKMQTNHINGYGYGWKIGTKHKKQVIFHTGLTDGFGSLIEIFPDDNIVIIMLSNIISQEMIYIRSNISEVFFDHQSSNL